MGNGKSNSKLQNSLAKPARAVSISTQPDPKFCVILSAQEPAISLCLPLIYDTLQTGSNLYLQLISTFSPDILNFVGTLKHLLIENNINLYTYTYIWFRLFL